GPSSMLRRTGPPTSCSRSNAPRPFWRGCLLAPTQRERVDLPRQLQEPVPGRRMQRVQGMANRVAADDAARGHHGFGGPEAALAVLVVDERQDLRVGTRRLTAAAGEMMGEDGPDQVGQQG